MNRRTFIGGCVAAGVGAALPASKPAYDEFIGLEPSGPVTVTLPAGVPTRTTITIRPVACDYLFIVNGGWHLLHSGEWIPADVRPDDVLYFRSGSVAQFVCPAKEHA